jgi:hypothetical protein
LVRGLKPAQKGILDDIFGVGCAAEHTVSDGEKKQAIVLKDVGRVF